MKVLWRIDDRVQDAVDWIAGIALSCFGIGRVTLRRACVCVFTFCVCDDFIAHRRWWGILLAGVWFVATFARSTESPSEREQMAAARVVLVLLAVGGFAAAIALACLGESRGIGLQLRVEDVALIGYWYLCVPPKKRPRRARTMSRERIKALFGTEWIPQPARAEN